MNYDSGDPYRKECAEIKRLRDWITFIKDYTTYYNRWDEKEGFEFPDFVDCCEQALAGKPALTIEKLRKGKKRNG